MRQTRSIHTIDCQYLHPQFAAAYLLTDGDEAAFIDNNTAHSVPALLSELKRSGLDPEQVRYVIITHVHLDHAGGTSALMNVCPQAQLLAHPRASKHMIDPSKLVTSARHVYGDDAFEKLYGQIEPIAASRVREVQDGESIPFGSGHPLRFIHTRGHANHHFCIHDPEREAIFTGDSFGLAYPALQTNGLFIFPSTSPTDFDYKEAVHSLELIVATRSSHAYLSHCGAVDNLAQAADQLRAHLEFSQQAMIHAAQSDLPTVDLAAFCETQLRAYFAEIANRRNLLFGQTQWDLLKLDLELNAAGLAHASLRIRNPKGT